MHHQQQCTSTELSAQSKLLLVTSTKVRTSASQFLMLAGWECEGCTRIIMPDNGWIDEAALQFQIRNQVGTAETTVGNSPVVGAAPAMTVQPKMLTQGFHNCTNVHGRDIPTIMQYGQPKGLQFKMLNCLTPPPTEKHIKAVKQSCAKRQSNRTSSCFVPLPQKKLQS